MDRSSFVFASVRPWSNRGSGIAILALFPMSLPWKELSAPAWLCIRIVKVPFAGKVGKDTFKDGAILSVYHIKISADSIFLL